LLDSFSKNFTAEMDDYDPLLVKYSMTPDKLKNVLSWITSYYNVNNNNQDLTFVELSEKLKSIHLTPETDNDVDFHKINLYTCFKHYFDPTIKQMKLDGSMNKDFEKNMIFYCQNVNKMVQVNLSEFNGDVDDAMDFYYECSWNDGFCDDFENEKGKLKVLEYEKFEESKIIYYSNLYTRKTDVLASSYKGNVLIETCSIIDLTDMKSPDAYRVYNYHNSNKFDTGSLSFLYAFGKPEFYDYIEERFKLTRINFKHILNDEHIYLVRKNQYCDFNTYKQMTINDIYSYESQSVKDTNIIESVFADEFEPMKYIQCYNNSDDKKNFLAKTIELFSNDTHAIIEIIINNFENLTDSTKRKWLDDILIRNDGKPMDLLTAISALMPNDVEKLVRSVEFVDKRLSKFKEDFELYPKNIFSGKNKLTIFGYNDERFRTLEILLKNKVYSLNSKEIKLSTNEYNLIKSMIYNVESTIDRLLLHQEDDIAMNDSYLSKILMSILSISVIDENCYDGEFFANISNLSSNYTIEREDYIRKNHPRKIRPRMNMKITEDIRFELMKQKLGLN